MVLFVEAPVRSVPTQQDEVHGTGKPTKEENIILVSDRNNSAPIEYLLGLCRYNATDPDTSKGGIKLRITE